MAIFSYLKSTILSKVVMAVTGIVIVGFVTGHMVGNLQVFLGRDIFNTYAHFLQSLGELLWAIRLFLLICLILHVITSIRLSLLNSGAKPVGYKVTKYKRATWASRTMIWTGLTIFAFLTYHLLHFTVGVTDPEIYGNPDYYESNASYFLESQTETGIEIDDQLYSEYEGGKVLFERHDAWGMVVAGFKKPVVSIVYLIAMVFLGFHLVHSIQSMFHTLGWNGPTISPFLRKLSIFWGIAVVIGYISIPISILTGLVGGCS